MEGRPPGGLVAPRGPQNGHAPAAPGAAAPPPPPAAAGRSFRRRGATAPAAAAARFAPTPARRRPPLVVLGVLLGALGALVAAAAVARVDDRRPVLVVARAVPAGQVLTEADFGVAQVAAEGVSALSPGELAAVVGKATPAALEPGTLVPRSLADPAPRLAPGRALVGVALTEAQVPTMRLRAGERVAVVRTRPPAAADVVGGADAAGGGAPPPDVLVDDATVAEAGAGEGATSALRVSLEVAEADAAAVAEAAAAGRVALVVVARP